MLHWTVFLYTSCVIGAFVVVTVGLVYWKHQTLKTAGMAMLLAGVVLIGFPVIANMSIAWNEKGFSVKFETIERKLASLNQNIEGLSDSAEGMVAKVEGINKLVNETRSASLASMAVNLQDHTNLIQGYQPMWTSEGKEDWIKAIKEATAVTDSVRKITEDDEQAAERREFPDHGPRPE